MIVFLHIPKTGGSSFNFILENSFGLRACHTNHTKKKVFDQGDLTLAMKLFPGLRSISGHNLGDPLRLQPPDPFYMTFVREPIARVLSRYQDSVIKGTNRLSFEQSLKEYPGFRNLQVRLMAGEEGLDKAKRFLEKCSFVGVTEKFDLSLHVLERLSPYKLNLRYKRRRVTPPNPMKAEVTQNPRLMELAREHNRLDLELYDFAVKEVFPRHCAQAGYQPEDKVPSFEYYRSEAQPKFIAFSLYNMLFYRQLCKLIYGPKLRSGEIERL